MILLIVFLALVLAAIVLAIWAAIDASRYPEWAFAQAGATKTIWVVAPIVTIFLCGFIALVPALMWFLSAKQTVVAATAAGPPT